MTSGREKKLFNFSIPRMEKLRVAIKEENMKINIVFILRILLGVIFSISGTLKVINQDAFIEALESYQLIPVIIIPFTGMILSILEILCGVSLTFGIFAQAGAIISSFLLIMFILISSITLFYGLNPSCGCFIGLIEQKLSYFSITQDILLFIISLILLKHYSRQTYRKNNSTQKILKQIA